jgi:hypothetical protein
MNRKTLSLLSAFSFALATSAVAQPTRPLTLEEVHCDQDHLTALLLRSQLLSSQRAKPISLTWTFGSAEGDFVGFAHTDQWEPSTVPFNPEKHLWVNLDRQVMPLSRNPSTVLLPTYTLSRLTTATDLLPPGNAERLELRIVPTHSESPPIGSQLRVDNLLGGIGTSTRRGIGLSGIEGRCHADFTKADLHALRVLTRVVRTYLFNNGGSSVESPDYEQQAIVYRGPTAEPLDGGGARTSFRVDAIDRDPDGSFRFSAEILIDIGADGRLGNATIRPLPDCTADGERDCTRLFVEGQIWVTRPTASGQNYPFPVEAFACKEGFVSQSCPSNATPFDFAEVLRESAWAKP